MTFNGPSIPITLPIVVLLLQLSAATAADGQLPASLQPETAPSDLFGDSNRGPEPDPTKASALPPHEVAWPINQGDPVNAWGHFRLRRQVLQGALSLPRDQRQALVDQFTTNDWGDGSLLRVSIMTPDPALARPAAGWPLIIYCPGSGDVGRGSLSTWGSLDPALVWATPTFRRHLPAVVMRMHPMQRTMQYGDGPLGAITTLPAFEAYLEAIDTMVTSGHIDRRRISVYGFSMGGSTTWALLRERPQLFAAAAPCAGSPITDIAAYSDIRETAIWMLMGNQDPWQGSAKYIWAYAQLRAHQHRKVRFWEVQDTAHSEDQVRLPSLAWWLWHQQRQ